MCSSAELAPKKRSHCSLVFLKSTSDEFPLYVGSIPAIQTHNRRTDVPVGFSSPSQFLSGFLFRFPSSESVRAVEEQTLFLWSRY